MRKKIAAGIVFGSILLGLPWGVLAATGDTGREPARTGDRGLAGSLPTRDAVSGRPAGGAIWTDEQVARIPDTREYLHRASPEARQRLAVFHGRYPDVDVTDASAFHEALISERGRKGFQVPEAEWSDYVAWTSETEAMQQSLVKARGLHAGLPIDGIDESGRGYTLIGFEGNLPVYNYTLNREAAVSSAASFVRMNSDFDALFGPDIDGSGLWVNVNDHGTIYDEHPEFSLPDDTSRIVLKEINDSGVRTHMTHVAGTVAAHGYEERAMGMAPRTWIRALIQQSTAHVLNYGMQTNGQAERSVVGNTSLGSPTDTPGMYTANDRTFDQALWDTPYYLHFYAAGNEGTGGFNTLTIYGKVCKNLITVGAVNDVARNADGTFSSGGAIAYFSSRGPARDGRIKPDIVANGVGLYSTGTSTGYSSMSGTSMASPNAAGSALLLVDYFTKRFPGQYPRASTVKALIINTTDDLGNPGPDYTYGWGLINTLRAAEIIKRQADHSASGVLVEDVLNSKQIVTMPYRHDGSGPIRVTLCWTDVAGSTQRNYNDQSPRLVNNLHLRLVGPGGESYYPYVMPYVTGTDTVSAFDASLYDATAVTGVNNTDNVIQVLIEEPPAGDYTIEITHAGNSLSGQQQAYSLAVSGMVYWDGTITPPEVPTSLTYPPSSSTGVYTVTWTAVGEADLYELERSSDEGTLWTQVYEGSGTLHDESIISNGSYRYRVRAINLAGPSDWLAGIQDCVVDIPVPLSSPSSLTYPTGSSTGRYHVIWTDVEGADHYDLERSADAGTAWTTVYSGTALSVEEMVNDGAYRYRVRAVDGGEESGWHAGFHDNVVQLSALELWRRENFVDPANEEVAGPMADANGDGIINLVKFALRGDPYADDGEHIAPRMRPEAISGDPVLTLRVREGGAFDGEGGYTVDGITYILRAASAPASGVWELYPLTELNAVPSHDTDGPTLHVRFDGTPPGEEVFIRLMVVLVAEE